MDGWMGFGLEFLISLFVAVPDFSLVFKFWEGAKGCNFSVRFAVACG